MTRRQSLRRGSFAAALLAGILTVVLLVIAVAVVLFLVSWVRGALATPGVLPGLPSDTGPSENVSYMPGSVLPTWSGQDRVTVLVMGIDERAQESGPWRTDTMMLMTLDPVAKQGGVLSIPRDLWVPIPGYNDGRINTAHFLGDLYGHSGGGPTLAVETVEYNLGVPIHYYARVNFQGFVDLVDLIGGVDVYVEEPISDPLYPGPNYDYDPLFIEAGFQHFDGELALKYARTRHGSSDFDRARRQQQILMAILERVTSMDMLPTLARNASKLYEIVQASVQTDMALDQMLALANVATTVERENIRFGVIDQGATQPWITPDGANVLVPIRDRMREICDYVFSTMQTDRTTGSGISAPTPTPELASVAVLNGTTRAGLAGATGDYLKENGVDVMNIGNAPRQDYATTLIIMNRDKPLTTARLVELLGLPTSAVVRGTEPEAAHDIDVILGADYAGPP